MSLIKFGVLWVLWCLCALSLGIFLQMVQLHAYFYLAFIGYCGMIICSVMFALAIQPDNRR